MPNLMTSNEKHPGKPETAKPSDIIPLCYPICAEAMADPQFIDLFDPCYVSPAMLQVLEEDLALMAPTARQLTLKILSDVVVANKLKKFSVSSPTKKAVNQPRRTVPGSVKMNERVGKELERAFEFNNTVDVALQGMNITLKKISRHEMPDHLQRVLQNEFKHLERIYWGMLSTCPLMQESDYEPWDIDFYAMLTSVKEICWLIKVDPSVKKGTRKKASSSESGPSPKQKKADSGSQEPASKKRKRDTDFSASNPTKKGRELSVLT
ncbi:uncharacterized protein DFL_005513 [Arthrobotrys flagrans]|uniref:Uncharacterized protein n=1 Tax=Arthrobotrys flagrans TaxID=97331 RepID=A0A436ZYB6_ARTFL|nr:hypothetical protein DFL_005513 [Arthrobotrys flagrans]